jgi:outer membrane lipoprotein-sorting protein
MRYLIVLALCSASAFGQDCKAYFDASDKLYTIPVHSYITHTVAKRNAEMIRLNGDSYFLIQGKWTKSSFNQQAIHEQELENRKNNKVSCQHVRDESVNGEAAAVYSTHSESEDATANGTAWISKSRGLLLRQEIDLEGDRISSRYEYSNVTAPKVSP